MAQGSMAERLPGVFIQYLPEQPVARIFINPVLYALADKPQRVLIVNNRERAECRLMGVDTLPGFEGQETARAGFVVYASKGVQHIDISKQMAQAWSLTEGHHLAWAVEGEQELGFLHSIIDMGR